jgi:hypothetical protein
MDADQPFKAHTQAASNVHKALQRMHKSYRKPLLAVPDPSQQVCMPNLLSNRWSLAQSGLPVVSSLSP